MVIRQAISHTFHFHWLSCYFTFLDSRGKCIRQTG